jgi:hypothetical protein
LGSVALVVGVGMLVSSGVLVSNRDLLALTMEIEFCTARREPVHGCSLKDPSFKRPTKLIAIAHRKSLPPLKFEKPSF